MPEQNFDFNELKELKLAQYKKQHLKPAVFKKCKGAIIFVDYKLAGKKTPCVIVPFKKGPIAAKTFKDVKKNKEHLLKKTGLASLVFGVDETGKPQVTIDLKKGGLSAPVLEAKAAKLFGEIKMAFKVVGNAEEVTEEQAEQNDNSAEETAEAPAATAQEVLNEIKAMIQTVAAAMKGQVKPVVANVKGKAVTESDRDVIDDVLDTISDLTAAFNDAEARIQNAVKAHYDKIIGYKPSLDKIQLAIEKLLPALEDAVEEVIDTVVDVADSISEVVNDALDAVSEALGEAFGALDNDIVEEETELPEDPAVQALRDLLSKGSSFIQNCSKELDSIESSIQQNAEAMTLPEGAALLNDLF